MNTFKQTLTITEKLNHAKNQYAWRIATIHGDHNASLIMPRDTHSL